MWLKSKRCVILWSIFVVVLYGRGECNAITNAQFNASLRDYAVHEEAENTTEVKTLQKEYQRYGHFTPIANAVKYKKVPDSVLAPSLSHSRGLLHHNHRGYGLADYDEGPHHESPHSGYGYEYHFPDEHDSHYDGHHHPDYHHHIKLHHDHHSHHDDHKYGHGHHHKYYDHALAAKTVLLPIAGIALLGAAAALVTNPVLLQLGVVSGKRRRRDTEEYKKEEYTPYIMPNITKRDFLRFHEKQAFVSSNFNNPNKGNQLKTPIYKPNIDAKGTTSFIKGTRHHKPIKKINSKVKKAIQLSSTDGLKYSQESEDKHYIPIPLKHKD